MEEGIPGYGNLLHIACNAKNPELFKECIENGLDYNSIYSCDIFGRSLVFIASQNKCLGILKLLVARDSNVFVDRNGNTVPKSLYEDAGLADSQQIRDFLTAHKIPQIYNRVEKIEAIKNDKVNFLLAYGSTPLSAALCQNNKQKLDNILKLKPGVNVTSSAFGRCSPLSYACLFYPDYVEPLIKLGAIVNYMDASGNSVLAHSVLHFKEETCAELVRNGADVNAFVKRGKPPLIWSVIYQRSLAMNFMLRHRAQVNICDGDGNTPLAYAAFNGDARAIQVLLRHGANVNLCATGGKMPLSWAVIGNHLHIVDLLLKKNAYVSWIDSFGNSALIYAARYQRLDILKHLLKNNAKIDCVANDKKSALIWAIIQNNIDIIKCLIENRASCRNGGKNGFKPLYYAISVNNLEVIKLLLGSGADLAIQSSFATSIRSGNVGVVKLLLDKGVVLTYDAFVALSYSKNMELMKLLVTKDMVFDETHKTNESFLQLAIQCNDANMVEMLLETGKYAGRLQAALATAIQWEESLLVERLLRKGADACGLLPNGEFPLKMAAMMHNFDLVKLFIDSGADLVDAKVELQEFARLDVDFRFYYENVSGLVVDNLKSDVVEPESKKECFKGDYAAQGPNQVLESSQKDDTSQVSNQVLDLHCETCKKQSNSKRCYKCACKHLEEIGPKKLKIQP